MDRHSASSSDPAKALVDVAVAGTLTEKTLTPLIAEAAQRQTEASYAGDLRQCLAPMLAAEFHKALKTGCADQILDSLREQWDAAAEQIAKARALFNAESSADHVLASGEPATIGAWQTLGSHLAVIGKIAAIASQFGPRIGNFPLITEFANSDGFRLEDRAIMCCDGGLEVDSAAFRRPDTGHRSSPWFAVPLKLHSVDSATERYRVWAEVQWNIAHPNPVIQQQRPRRLRRRSDFDQPIRRKGVGGMTTKQPRPQQKPPTGPPTRPATPPTTPTEGPGKQRSN